MADAIRALLTIDPCELFFGIIESMYLELTMELCSTFHLQTVILWCMSHGHVIDLAYFISLAIQHQTKRHRKGSSPLSPTGIEEPTLPNIVSPNLLRMRPTRTFLICPPQHKDPLTQPPPPSRPVHAAASYAGISERLTRFE
ncbi:hypothetical protein GOBAR_AA18691 [Gossypium barbadense]|uniref:Uncharacterized protein n=1 Tax=Gossypium barbadense TaxID=3634 RepID=A0A2P5XF89_GOSBA|nr:hypothetical protein GOBAR_AA18691 [Gossypium barbadense]